MHKYLHKEVIKFVFYVQSTSAVISGWLHKEKESMSHNTLTHTHTHTQYNNTLLIFKKEIQLSAFDK